MTLELHRLVWQTLYIKKAIHKIILQKKVKRERDTQEATAVAEMQQLSLVDLILHSDGTISCSVCGSKNSKVNRKVYVLVHINRDFQT